MKNRLEKLLFLASLIYVGVTSRIEYCSLSTRVDELEMKLRDIRRKQEGKE